MSAPLICNEPRIIQQYPGIGEILIEIINYLLMYPSLSWYWVPAALELSPQDIALSSAEYNGIIAQEKHGYWQESEKPPWT